MLTLLWSRLGIILFIYIVVLFVVVLDLWSGVRKAKRRKEYRSSAGYRRTVEKLARYYNLIFAFTATDSLQMGFLWQYNSENGSHFPMLPFFTLAVALFICFIEIKSIFESADKKTRKQYHDAAAQIAEMLRHKEGASALAAIAEGLTKDTDQKEGA